MDKEELPEEDRIVAEAIAAIVGITIGDVLYEAGFIPKEAAEKIREDVKEEVRSQE